MKFKNTFIKIKQSHFRFILSTVIISLLICGVFNANIANTPKPEPTKSKPAKKILQQQPQDESKISKDAVKLFIKGVEIHGTIAKPQAIFIISATDPKVDGLKINRHFFDDIFRNVEKSSLKRVRKKQAKKNKDIIQW